MLLNDPMTVRPMGRWADHGACVGYRQEHGDERWLEVWFPDPGNQYQHREAKAICAGCPSRQECLDWAIQNRVNYGVWGGTTHAERRRIWAKMRREGRGVTRVRPRPACGTEAGYKWENRYSDTTCPSCRLAHTETVKAQKKRRRRGP